MLIKMTVDQFSEVLASDSPTPGGGSVAALSGALGAALVAMVGRLTSGKKGYEEHTMTADSAIQAGDRLRQSLLRRVDLDTEAFNSVMTAFKMPKDTEEAKAARAAAIQQGYKEALESPLGIARECIEVLQAAKALVGRSNTNALSDLGVAGEQAHAGLLGALMNVRINLLSLKDTAFADRIRSEVTRLQAEGAQLKDHVWSHVDKELAKGG